jgi:uncharacterized protein YkwD
MHRTLMPLVVAVAAAALLSPADAQAACDDLDRADAVVCEINELRTERGLARVSPDRRLERAGEAYARDMVRRGFFSHVSLDGAGPADRLRASGYITGEVAWRAGEVLAWGRGRRATPAATVDAWMQSPPHRRILLSARYRDIGVGVAPGVPFGGPGRTYATELGVLG